MKTLIINSILAVLVATGTAAMAQNQPDEYLGLPGDNLNLYAVMKLFQESETLESFERNLNDENSKINNLDLNGDNMVDYITVNDYVDGDVHNIVLRTALNRNENQDVAVFTVQRFRNGSVQIQLIGDEALYGRNYIIEPINNDNYAETPNPGYTGRPANSATVVRTTVYEVAAWPLIRFIYLPHYVVWRSSWYWGYYPVYWHPWRPFFWHFYYGYHYNWHHDYYSHYRHWNHYRYARYNDFYYRGLRAHSAYVDTRIREGNYRYTYSRPETRRDGEALYSKTYRRENTNTMVSGQNRRSVSQSTRPMTMSGSNSQGTRRTSATIENRPVSKTSEVRNAGTTRRASTTANSRPNTSSSTAKYASSSRYSSTNDAGRSYNNSTPAYNNSVQRRTTVSTGAGSYNRPSSVQNSGSAGRSATTRQPAKVSPAQSSGASRRSPAMTSSGSSSKPSASGKSYSSGSHRQSSVSSGPSTHRSSQVSRSNSSSGKSSGSGKSDNSSSSRRR